MLWMGCDQGYTAAHVAQIGRMSFWGTIYPFVEQQQLYDKCIDGTQGTAGQGIDRRFDSTWWWDELSEPERQAFGSVSYYRCPSRRGGGAQYVREGRAPNSSPGPQGDFAILAACNNTSGIATGTGARLLGSVWMPGVAQCHTGPFRVAEASIEANRIRSWQPRDTMAWWQDGTSNQIIVSEKHIPDFSLGKCYCTNNSASGVITEQFYDCSYLGASGATSTATQMRADIAAHAFVVSQVNGGSAPPTNISGRLIARGDSVDETASGRWISDTNSPVLGSAHPAVFNVLIGDGSVHGISKAVLNHIIARFTVVSDGVAEPLPIM